ncbi:MAG: YbjN domain-containing protein [Acidimicrobiales bacterium]
MEERASTPSELADLEELFDSWIHSQLESNPTIAAVERDEGEERVWFVRVLGEDRESYTVRFALGQRTLAFDSYFLPAPIENEEQFYRQLLRRNRDLFGVAFCIGDEEAVFLAGQLSNPQLNVAALDRVLGTVYATVERCFRAALSVGFVSQLGPGAEAHQSK